MFLDIQEHRFLLKKFKIKKADYQHVASDFRKECVFWPRITLKNVCPKVPKTANCQHSLADSEAQTSHATQFLRPSFDSQFYTIYSLSFSPQDCPQFVSTCKFSLKISNVFYVQKRSVKTVRKCLW